MGRTLLRTLTTVPDQQEVYGYPDQACMCRYQQHSLTELHQKYIYIFRILFCLVLCSYLVILDFRNKGIYLLCMCMRGACQESEWSVGYYIYPLYLVHERISSEVFIVLSLPDLLCSFLRANNLLLVLYSLVYFHYGFGVYSLLCSDCNVDRDSS